MAKLTIFIKREINATDVGNGIYWHRAWAEDGFAVSHKDGLAFGVYPTLQEAQDVADALAALTDWSEMDMFEARNWGKANRELVYEAMGKEIPEAQSQ